MSQPLSLFGLSGSVYTRVAQIVLAEIGLEYTHQEVDPFEQPPPEGYTSLHPFCRVPVLKHGDFVLYETQAISTYLDAAFNGAALTPENPQARARMGQVMSIIDAYGYWPMVRQVFVQRVWNPLDNLPVDEDIVATGLTSSRVVLGALETIAAEGHVLTPARLTLACAHLAPMIDYFVMAPEGADALSHYPHLARWWSHARSYPSVQATAPDLP